MRRSLQISLIAALLSCSAAHATPAFAFDGAGGALTGVAGGTIGWGFTLSDSAEFLVISETDFCPTSAVQSDVPANCDADSASLGTYTDFSPAIPVVGPSPDTTPLTQNFDLGTDSGGFGSFAINGGASPGTTDGEIAIIYDLFTGDPNTDPSATQIGGDNFTSLPASITVSAPGGVPEPRSWMFVALGSIAMGLHYRARRKRFIR